MGHAAFNSDYAFFTKKSDEELIRLSISCRNQKHDRIITGLLVKRGLWTKDDYDFYWGLINEPELIYE